MPFVFPFLSRVQVFRQLIRTHLDVDDGYGRQHLDIHRQSAYQDAFDQLSGRHEQLAQRFRVRIIAATGDPEEGIDGGGLFREFLQMTLKAGFDPACGYFKASSEQELYPDPDVTIHAPDFNLHYRFLGNLLGLALRNDMLVELPFCRFFLSKLLGQRAGLQDLASLDSELFRNLLVVKDYDGDVAGLGLDFTVTGNELTGHRVFELVPNGSQLNVDSSNKIRYVYYVADFHLNKRLAPQTHAFAQGLHDLVKPSWLSLFGPLELQKLVSGDSSGIDLQDLRQHVVYGHGFNEDHPTIQLLWRVLQSFSIDELKALIQFITSCPRPPILGFGALRPKIGIWNSTDTARLPTASTCINQLKLPPYTDEETLRVKLKQAITGAQGFGLS
jgi:ubiquitin-protein ligase E3 C